MVMNMLVLGAGYSGRAIGRRLSGEAKLSGTTRSRDNFPALEAAGFDPFVLDGAPDEALLDRLAEATHLVQSIAPSRKAVPGERGVDPFLAALPAPLETLAPHLEWVGYLSTVGVYGNHDGAWVDEEKPPRPVSTRSKRRLTAENEWLAWGERADVAVAVLRLSGIYGPGRNAFVAAQEGRARRLVKKGQVFNRIFVTDIAEAVALGARDRWRGTVNVTDDEPAPPQDVVAFAHELMGREPPPEQDFETADLSPMARSFYGENKRVSNARSKALGLTYRYPNYREALAAMWPVGWK